MADAPPSVVRLYRGWWKLTVLPSMVDLYTQWCRKKANRIIEDPNHPSLRLFCLLPSGRRYRSILSRTTRLRDSFVPCWTLALISSLLSLHLHLINTVITLPHCCYLVVTTCLHPCYLFTSQFIYIYICLFYPLYLHFITFITFAHLPQQYYIYIYIYLYIFLFIFYFIFWYCILVCYILFYILYSVLIFWTFAQLYLCDFPYTFSEHWWREPEI